MGAGCRHRGGRRAAAGRRRALARPVAADAVGHPPEHGADSLRSRSQVSNPPSVAHSDALLPSTSSGASRRKSQHAPSRSPPQIAGDAVARSPAQSGAEVATPRAAARSPRLPEHEFRRVRSGRSSPLGVRASRKKFWRWPGGVSVLSRPMTPAGQGAGRTERLRRTLRTAQDKVPSCMGRCVEPLHGTTMVAF
jgi:hypothetical protein